MLPPLYNAEGWERQSSFKQKEKGRNMRNLALLDVQLLWERARKALISGPQDPESISQAVHDLAWGAWVFDQYGHPEEGKALFRWLMEEPNISHLRSYAIG